VQPGTPVVEDLSSLAFSIGFRSLKFPGVMLFVSASFGVYYSTLRTEESQTEIRISARISPFHFFRLFLIFILN
jgi:hypothetical protein